jgi:hypothetical protein
MPRPRYRRPAHPEKQFARSLLYTAQPIQPLLEVVRPISRPSLKYGKRDRTLLVHARQRGHSSLEPLLREYRKSRSITCSVSPITQDESTAQAIAESLTTVQGFRLPSMVAASLLRGDALLRRRSSGVALPGEVNDA